MNKEYIHIDTKTDEPLQNQIINIRKQQIKEETEFEIHEFINQKLKEKDKEIEKLKNDKKKVLELIENDYFEDGSFENYYEVKSILKGNNND